MPPPIWYLPVAQTRSHRALVHAVPKEEHQKREKASPGHSANTLTRFSEFQRGEMEKMEKEDVTNEYDTIDDWSEEALLRVDLDKELEPSTTEKPQFELSILRGGNYDMWASELQRFLELRGIFCIVTGDLPIPRDRRDKARRWVILDRWIAVLIYFNVEGTQRKHIGHLKNSKAMWDKLKQTYGVREPFKWVQPFLGLFGEELSRDSTLARSKIQ